MGKIFILYIKNLQTVLNSEIKTLVNNLEKGYIIIKNKNEDIDKLSSSLDDDIQKILKSENFCNEGYICTIIEEKYTKKGYNNNFIPKKLLNLFGIKNNKEGDYEEFRGYKILNRELSKNFNVAEKFCVVIDTNNKDKIFKIHSYKIPYSNTNTNGLIIYQHNKENESLLGLKYLGNEGSIDLYREEILDKDRKVKWKYVITLNSNKSFILKSGQKYIIRLRPHIYYIVDVEEF